MANIITIFFSLILGVTNPLEEMKMEVQQEPVIYLLFNSSR